ncbi:hypothetical protein MPTK1_1g26985 [Marchantia polymorpha subsp. ruderalis]
MREDASGQRPRDSGCIRSISCSCSGFGRPFASDILRTAGHSGLVCLRLALALSADAADDRHLTEPVHAEKEKPRRLHEPNRDSSLPSPSPSLLDKSAGLLKSTASGKVSGCSRSLESSNSRPAGML